MNKIIINAKRTITFITLAMVLVVIGFTAKAAGHESGKNRPGSANTAEVTYIGSDEGQPLFNVVYNNIEGGRFTISIVDESGNELFQGTYSGKDFDKKFKLTDAGSNSKLSFIIRNYKDNSVQTFEVNANSRLVEDIEVKEVK